MKCRHIQKRLSAYIDNEMGREERKTLDAHLEACETCRFALERMRGVWVLIGEVPQPEAVPYFMTRLNARLGEQKSHSGLIERILLPVSVAAVIFLGTLMGSYFGMNGNQVNTESQAEVEVVSIDYIDHLSDLPSASLSEAYFNLAYQK